MKALRVTISAAVVASVLALTADPAMAYVVEASDFPCSGPASLARQLRPGSLQSPQLPDVPRSADGRRPRS